MSTMFSLVFILFLILFVAVTILSILNIIKRAKNTALSILGTDSLREGFEQIEAEFAATPKSVSAVTSLYLPKIVKDFPEFNLEQMRTRAENVLVSYLRSLDHGVDQLPQDCSPEFRQQLMLQLRENASRHRELQYREIKIHRTEISNYRKVPGRCIVTFQTALQSFCEKGMVQSKWNTDVIYTQDSQQTATRMDDGLGINCPNCGAPITTLGNKVCQYCGTEVVELNIHAWMFNKVENV